MSNHKLNLIYSAIFIAASYALIFMSVISTKIGAIAIAFGIVFYIINLWKAARSLGKNPWLWCIVATLTSPIGILVSCALMFEELNKKRS